MKSMRKIYANAYNSLALSLKAFTAYAFIGWEHGRDGKGVKAMTESDKDTPWGIKAQSSRGYEISLGKQHANVFNFDTF